MALLDKLKSTGFIAKETFKGAIDDNILKLSAALSYYTIFSLPPLLIIIISISGIFFGDDAVRGQLFGQINGLVGNVAASQIQEAIKNVKLSDSNAFATTLGLFILFIGASGVFAEIQESLNFIWGIKAKPNRGFMKFIKNRIMSFSMIGSVGFLLLVSLIINSVTDVLNSRLSIFFPVDALYIFNTLNIIIIFVITSMLFVLIFRTLPDGRIALRDCAIGGAFTALLFMVGKFGIGAYLGSSTIASVYGAAGSVILILVWVYYSAIILYFGAEFTKVYAINHGDKIIPNEYSVKLVTKTIEIDPDNNKTMVTNDKTTL